MSKEYMTFGNRLKRLRLSRGLTQAELAEQIHVSSTSINRYEHGLREPSIGTINVITDFFNVDYNYLFGKPTKSPIYEEIDLVLIHKFHALDARGQAAVLNVLEYEYTIATK